MESVQRKAKSRSHSADQRVEAGRRLGRAYANAQGVSLSVAESVCSLMERVCPYMRHGFNQITSQRGRAGCSRVRGGEFRDSGWVEHREAVAAELADCVPA